ncbi:MAG TPA: chitobiase/beta-hexosaminidase C-terminal domain-containing protein, partial [Vicinamibacterales bacterium]|nr:chitobiase/beta-hexosaminidase C-terminal domain-containing protein [Vicinamibacterales bacterium]
MSTSRARIAAGLLTIALCAGAPAIVTAQGAPFYTVTPCRVLDTRAAVGPFGAPALGAGATRAFSLAGQCGVATSAAAVSINLTVVAPSGAGNLNVYPVGIAQPVTSAINFNVGSTRANNAVVALGSGGGIVIAAIMSGGVVDVIVDVNGYFDALPPGAVAPPALTPPPGSYSGAQYVSLASSTPGASIRYTLDGSAPSSTVGTLYGGAPIKLLGNTTVRAVAYTGVSTVSAIAGGDYAIVLADVLFLATLRPQNGATTLGAGSASLVLAGDQATARLYETYSNLTGDLIGQHIHEADGSIVFDVDTAVVEADGSRIWTLVPVGTFTPAQLVADLFAGKLYLNLHTAQYPSGEIKGFFQLATGSQTFTPPPPPPPLPPPPPTARDAARFLAQATFGATPSEIPALQTQGFDSWLNAQFAT